MNYSSTPAHGQGNRFFKFTEMEGHSSRLRCGEILLYWFLLFSQVFFVHCTEKSLSRLYCTKTTCPGNNCETAEFCSYVCNLKASKCHKGDPIHFPRNFVEPWLIDKECFNAQKIGNEEACQFNFEKESTFEYGIKHGLEFVSVGVNRHVTFSTELKDPVVIVQASVSTVDIIGTPFVYSVSDKGFSFVIHVLGNVHIPESLRFLASWFAISSSSDEFKDFKEMHTDVKIIKVYPEYTEYKISEENNVKMSNLAFFFQLYSENHYLEPHIDYERHLMGLKYVPKVDKSFTSLSCAVLMIDLSFYKFGYSYRFGNLDLSFVMPVLYLGEYYLHVDSKMQPLLFFTPYYRLSANVKPSLSSRWINEKDGGYFKCRWSFQQLTEPFYGTPGIFLLINTDSIPAEARRASLPRDDTVCSNVRSMIAFKTKAGAITYKDAKTSPLKDLSSTEVETINDLDDICLKKCLDYMKGDCKDNVLCLQSLLWPNCNLIWSHKDALKNMEDIETRESDTEILKYFFVNIGSEVCPKGHSLVPYDQLDYGDWANSAYEFCSVHRNLVSKGSKLNPILVISYLRFSKDFCDVVYNKTGQITWLTMDRLGYAIDRTNYHSITLDSLTTKYNVSAICWGDDKKILFTPLLKDFANVYGTSLHDYDPRDCIETEWGSWSSCSSNCIPEDGIVVRQRTRGILYPGTKLGRQCVTSETQECSDLPPCSEECLLTPWTSWTEFIDSKMTRNRAAIRYSAACDAIEFSETKDFTPPHAEEHSSESERPLGDKYTEIPGESFIEVDSDCELWSEWSACSVGCEGTEGLEYRISGRSTGENKFKYCNKVESRSCVKQFQCGLERSVDCSIVEPVYHSSDSMEYCQEECLRLLDVCKNKGYGYSFDCFVKLEARLLDFSDFFFKCRLPQDEGVTLDGLRKVFGGRCFLARASYSTAHGSWVDENSQSCFCSTYGAVPCTVRDVHVTQDSLLADLKDLNFCPLREISESFFLPGKREGSADSVAYISLAEGKRLHCPLPVIKDDIFTFGQFESMDLLGEYCRYGSAYSLMNHTLKDTPKKSPKNFDCLTVRSKEGDPHEKFCKDTCKSLKNRCADVAVFLKCVRDRLLINAHHEADLFKKYGCSLPIDPAYDFGDDCHAVYVNTAKVEDRIPCLSLCRNAQLHCRAEDLKGPNSYNECMHNIIYGTEDAGFAYSSSYGNVIESFRNLCEFDPGKQIGEGYVLCKFTENNCEYKEWSQWSNCDRSCNKFDSIATRYRTRELIDSMKGRDCRYGDLGALEIGICLHQEGCGKAQWIDEVQGEDTRIRVLEHVDNKNREDLRIKEWILNTYDNYPELKDSPVCNTNCRILKSTKISSGNARCGCPRNYVPCEPSAAVSNPGLLEDIESLCKSDKLASILFEGKVDNYRYHCNIGMLLIQYEHTEGLSCDHIDNNEYVVCEAKGDRGFRLRHGHSEPPHFAYRGDHLPEIKCAEIQEIVHANERMIASKKLAPLREAKHPLYEFECSTEGTSIELCRQLSELHDRILTTNWHDSIQLMMNADIWEGVLSRIKMRSEDVPDMQVQVMLSKTLEIFDTLFQAEDVQDHIYELIEEASRGGGKTIENFEEHIAAILKKYEQLKSAHPRYVSKLKESIGSSLAILRQRYNFDWPEEHKYFY